MKTRKFTRVISFILSIAFVFSTVAIKASAYSTETISYDCPKSLCTEDLVISGAYGDPDEIIDSEVPYFGGMTLQDVMDNRNITNKDYHLHIFYCPKFDINDASLFRHTMTLMFAQHGYTTKSYSQYNEYYHYANKQCDHAKEINGSYVHALTQELCGENALIDNETLNELIIYQGQFGCGKETAVLETHTWSYGDWVDNGDGTCSRIVSCSDCGYSETVTQIHDLSYSDWEWDSNDSDRGATHKRTITCSKCSYEEIVSQSHDDYWVWIEDSWEPSGNDGCTCSKKCSVCGKTVFIYNKHQFSTTNYVCLSDTQHEQTLTCSLCGTTRTEIKNHGYTSTVYEPYSETQHKYSKTCFCDYVSVTYSDHRDNNSDLYCDDCGYNMTRFSVTLPTTMNFVMSKTGEVYSADTVKLFNNSTAPVSVKQVRLETVNGWSLTKYDEKAIASAKVDSKLIGFKLKNAETSSSGQTETLNFTDWSISKGVYQSFTYDAVISATSVPIENEQIMNVVFVVDWNVDIRSRVVSYDIKELGKQLKKIGMLIVQDQVWNRVTVNREAHKSTRYYIDEMHLLLKEEQTAAYTVEIWKRFRKWGGIPTGITQNVKDLLSSREIENIFENSDYIYMLNQASGDRQILARQLNISPHQLSYVTQSGEGEGLIFYGSTILPFTDRFPKDTELYKIMTTKPQEKAV